MQYYRIVRRRGAGEVPGDVVPASGLWYKVQGRGIVREVNSGVFCFFVSLGLFFPGPGSDNFEALLSDARPCLLRLRLWRCPVSALVCLSPGPLGDTLGRFSLVLVSKSGVSCSVYRVT